MADPVALAAEIASGRLKAHVEVHKEPVDIADVLSGKVKAFQPSAWQSPAWRKTKTGRSDKQSGQCGYVCDDPWQQVYAMQAFVHNKFNLPGFDLWLDKMPPCGLRDELARLRHGLEDAIAEGDKKAVSERLARLEVERGYADTVLALPPAFQPPGHRAPMIAMQTVMAVRSNRQKRASGGHHNKPSPYVSEFQNWTQAAARELAVHADAKPVGLAKAIKGNAATQASDRYLRTWVGKNLTTIEALAVKYRDKARQKTNMRP